MLKHREEIRDSKGNCPCGKDNMKFLLNLLRFSTDVNPINVTTQTTAGASMADTMKTFYEKSLLENARSQMVFTPLGKHVPLTGTRLNFVNSIPSRRQ